MKGRGWGDSVFTEEIYCKYNKKAKSLKLNLIKLALTIPFYFTRFFIEFNMASNNIKVR